MINYSTEGESKPSWFTTWANSSREERKLIFKERRRKKKKNARTHTYTPYTNLWKTHKAYGKSQQWEYHAGSVHGYLNDVSRQIEQRIFLVMVVVRWSCTHKEKLIGSSNILRMSQISPTQRNGTVLYDATLAYQLNGSFDTTTRKRITNNSVKIPNKSPTDEKKIACITLCVIEHATPVSRIQIECHWIGIRIRRASEKITRNHFTAWIFVEDDTFRRIARKAARHRRAEVKVWFKEHIGRCTKTSTNHLEAVTTKKLIHWKLSDAYEW